jgi:NAD(P)-dependent dehydrogenase (short-subunit alcohol dehydrogenase family)
MAKLAFITGAASGLGQALAWRYHLAGAELAASIRDQILG